MNAGYRKSCADQEYREMRSNNAELVDSKINSPGNQSFL